MRKQFLILIFGHFASGKTTLAKKIEKEFNFSRVNSDDIRDFLISKIKHYSGAHYSYYNDKINSANRVVSKFKDYLIKELLRQGQSLIIDGGRKTRDKRKKYVRLKKICSKKLISIIIETKLDEKKIIKRLKSRDAKNKQHRWVKFYYDFAKKEYESLNKNEADHTFTYNQKNSKELIEKLKKIIKV